MIFDQLSGDIAALYRRYLFQTLVLAGITPNETITNEELLEFAAQIPGAADWPRFAAWAHTLGKHVLPLRSSYPVVVENRKGKLSFSRYRQQVMSLQAGLTSTKATIKQA